MVAQCHEHKVPDGAFVVEIGADGAVEVIPHVGVVLIDPTAESLPVATTLAGDKVLDACLARRTDVPIQDVVRALVIPDSAGPPPPAPNAAYLHGAKVFDGERFHTLDANAAKMRMVLAGWISDLRELWAWPRTTRGAAASA
jgi:hypothetical protein